MTSKTLAFFKNPFVVMWLVVSMYVVKTIVKIGIGSHVNSPMITGDGFHNLADIMEALAVIAVIYVAKRPASDDYPFGKKNIEFFTSLAIGLALLFLSLKFALQSAVGLLHFAPSADAFLRSFLPLPAHEPLVMDNGTFPWLVAITAGSVILSFIVSRYQIAVGNATGHASLVADGKETLSDGRIEVITLVGVLGEYWLHLPILEYFLGLVVAAAVWHTGWGLYISAARVLLQHSIGADHEDAIRKACLSVPGVESVESLKTFQVGQHCVCMLSVTTLHGAEAGTYIKYGVESRIKQYVLANGFTECDVQVKFQKPTPDYHRIAYAVVSRDGVTAVAPDLASATSIIICDMEHGNVVRTTAEPMRDDVARFLKGKRVKKLYLFADDPEQLDGVEVESATTFVPSLLGLLCP